MKIYVGNLSFDITEDELSAEFSAFGNVESVAIPTDKFSGRPKGFAFVEMASKSEAEAAITGLNGKNLRERTIVVNESRPRTDNRATVYLQGEISSKQAKGAKATDLSQTVVEENQVMVVCFDVSGEVFVIFTSANWPASDTGPLKTTM